MPEQHYRYAAVRNSAIGAVHVAVDRALTTAKFPPMVGRSADDSV